MSLKSYLILYSITDQCNDYLACDMVQKNKIAHVQEALAIRRIFSLVNMITKAKFSNSPNDFKIRLFG